MFKEQKIDLGEIALFEKIERTIQLRNTQKYSSVFHVVEIPPFCEISPMKYKLDSEEVLQIKLSFCCHEEQSISSQIGLLFRGGKVLKIPFIVKASIPMVVIREEQLDFGSITVQGTPVQIPLTLQNKSNVTANLKLDLRNKGNLVQGLDCL